MGAEVKQQKGWFGRNWFWVVPMGCLGMITMFAGLIAVIIVVVFGAIKSSEPYNEALTRAKNDAAVQAALGTPIETGFLVGGSIEVTPSSGTADIAIPITGPNGSGTVYVIAEKSAGEWTYQRMEVEIAGAEERISLLGEGIASEEEP